MLESLAAFVPVCLVTSLVCTALKEEEPRRLAAGTGRLFSVLAAGLVAFGLVVQLLTVILG
jgi:hypothetical protein